MGAKTIFLFIFKSIKRYSTIHLNQFPQGIFKKQKFTRFAVIWLLI